MERFRYYSDFLLPPAFIAAAVLPDREAWGGVWLLLAIFGLLLFTFIEYWTHRTILHKIMWHSTHQRHHQHPEEHVVFPWWYLPSIFAAFYLALPAAVFSGFMLGALWFFVWHHVIHHWDLKDRPWIQAYERWHNIHHRDLPYNYGITMPLWDIVFRTYKSPADVRWRT